MIKKAAGKSRFFSLLHDDKVVGRRIYQLAPKIEFHNRHRMRE